MKQYSHDYSKVAEAESLLYSATQLMANESWDAALERINETRQLLQEYLAKDNMVEDDDVADGWVKSIDTFNDDQLVDIRDVFGEALAGLKDKKSNDESITRAIIGVAKERLDIINVCQRNLYCDEYNSTDEFWNDESGTWCERKKC